MPERRIGRWTRVATGAGFWVSLVTSATCFAVPSEPRQALPHIRQPTTLNPQPATAGSKLDPSAWGDDHVGKPVPEYMTGDECLFCHREKIGSTWGTNRHNLTVRAIDERSPALAALKRSPARQMAGEVKFTLGGQRRQRFLKPSKSYGKMDMLSVEWAPPRGALTGKLVTLERPHWDTNTFATACAGCHSTAVDPKDQIFSAVSLDCFVCHGIVSPEHSKDTALVHLSRKRNDRARLVTSICAQCHVRSGTSRSTGRPYSTNFVAGDNLFRDFRVDFSDKELNSLSVEDRHVLANVRDVVVHGKEAVTCLTCHDIHGRSSKRHQVVQWSAYCLNCHSSVGPKGKRKAFAESSKTCGY